MLARRSSTTHTVDANETKKVLGAASSVVTSTARRHLAPRQNSVKQRKARKEKKGREIEREI